MKFAAIDIGSNAVRLLFMQVFEYEKNTVFKKDALFRVPIRLGEDVFVSHKIPSEKANSLLKTMIAFRYLIEAYNPVDFMACATSAMREAQNGDRVVKNIKEQADFDIAIIDGKKEAEIIYSNHIAERLDPDRSYLYIDVGGGSTEITLISQGEIVDSHSFNLGTVRILKEQAPQSEWDKMKAWLKALSKEQVSVAGIGSGGNINKIFKLSRKKSDKPLSYKNIKKIYEHIHSFSFNDRIQVLGLRPDRADVIIPAAKIFLSAMKWADIEKLYVPQIGLADGIIHVLYEKQKREHLHF